MEMIHHHCIDFNIWHCDMTRALNRMRNWKTILFNGVLNFQGVVPITVGCVQRRGQGQRGESRG